MATIYVPDRCDVVWLDFDPQAGHKQAGRRPAFVISPRQYNSVSGLAIFCPITSRIKNYPYEVIISGNKKNFRRDFNGSTQKFRLENEKCNVVCKLSDEIFEDVKMKYDTLV